MATATQSGARPASHRVRIILLIAAALAAVAIIGGVSYAAGRHNGGSGSSPAIAAPVTTSATISDSSTASGHSSADSHCLPNLGQRDGLTLPVESRDETTECILGDLAWIRLNSGGIAGPDAVSIEEKYLDHFYASHSCDWRDYDEQIRDGYRIAQFTLTPVSSPSWSSTSFAIDVTVFFPPNPTTTTHMVIVWTGSEWRYDDCAP